MAALADRWRWHNALERVGPMVVVWPEGSWSEVLPDESLLCTEPLARAWEADLRRRLIHAEFLRDDTPVTSVFWVGWVWSDTGYGVEVPHQQGEHRGSYAWTPPFDSFDAIPEKLSMRRVSVDEDATRRRSAMAEEAFDGLLSVEIGGPFWWTMGLTWRAIDLVGLEGLMLGMVDDPTRDTRRVHINPIPRVGGVAVALVMALALAVQTQALDGTLWLLSGIGVLLAAGIVDDRGSLSPAPKLLAQAVAVALAMAGGWILPSVPIPLLGIELTAAWATWPVTLVLGLGLINATNLIDGLDGLAAGIGCVSALAFAAMAGLSGDVPACIASTALAGCLVGTLAFNSHPARVFLGDTGSMIIGFVHLDTADAVRLAEQLVATQDLGEPEVMLDVEVLEVASSVVQEFGLRYPDRINYGVLGTGADQNAAPDLRVAVAVLSARPGLHLLSALYSPQLSSS